MTGNFALQSFRFRPEGPESAAISSAQFEPRQPRRLAGVSVSKERILHNLSVAKFMVCSPCKMKDDPDGRAGYRCQLLIVSRGLKILELLKEPASEIISFLVGLGGGSLLTLRLTRNQRIAGEGTISDQRNARAGGDMVGRDKVTNDPPPTRRR